MSASSYKNKKVLQSKSYFLNSNGDEDNTVNIRIENGDSLDKEKPEGSSTNPRTRANVSMVSNPFKPILETKKTMEGLISKTNSSKSLFLFCLFLF